MISAAWVRPRSALPSARGVRRAITQQILVEPMSSTEIRLVRPGCTGLRRAVIASVIMVLPARRRIVGVLFEIALVLGDVRLGDRRELLGGRIRGLYRHYPLQREVDHRHVALEHLKGLFERGELPQRLRYPLLGQLHPEPRAVDHVPPP